MCWFNAGISWWQINTGPAFLAGLPACLSNRPLPSQSFQRLALSRLQLGRLSVVAHCGESSSWVRCLEGVILVPHPDSNAEKGEKPKDSYFFFFFPEEENYGENWKALRRVTSKKCTPLLAPFLVTAQHSCQGSRHGVCGSHTSIPWWQLERQWLCCVTPWGKIFFPTL